MKYTIKYVVVDKDGEEHTFYIHTFGTYEDTIKYVNEIDSEEILNYVNIMTDSHYTEILEYSYQIIPVIDFEN